MNYGEIGEECWASGCRDTSTHVLTTRVLRADGDMELKTAYCMKDAMFFAAWLPYRYPNEHKFVSITPSAEEFFGKR